MKLYCAIFLCAVLGIQTAIGIREDCLEAGECQFNLVLADEHAERYRILFVSAHIQCISQLVSVPMSALACALKRKGATTSPTMTTSTSAPCLTDAPISRRIIALTASLDLERVAQSALSKEKIIP